ncbi:MAG: hypothetical protein NT001_03410 [Candidatus Woesearchaeota archaeon]|nr:hypothetical protein [Candidatus Woesearchaeota archaeon]
MQDPREEPKKHGLSESLFGKHEAGISPVSVADLSNQINNLSRRLRMLEERYTSLRKNEELTDHNILKITKGMQRDTAVVTSDLTELRRDFIDLKDKVKLIVKELVECAKSEDVKVLERYINLWDPMKFVSKDEVMKIVEDKLEECGIEPNAAEKSKDLKE